MISKKRAPLSADRTIQQIYDDINEIINAVNSTVDESRDYSSGKPGDIRVVKDAATNRYKLEAYTVDGWTYANLVFSDTEVKITASDLDLTATGTKWSSYYEDEGGNPLFGDSSLSSVKIPFMVTQNAYDVWAVSPGNYWPSAIQPDDNGTITVKKITNNGNIPDAYDKDDIEAYLISSETKIGAVLNTIIHSHNIVKVTLEELVIQLKDKNILNKE